MLNIVRFSIYTYDEKCVDYSEQILRLTRASNFAVFIVWEEAKLQTTSREKMLKLSSN